VRLLIRALSLRDQLRPLRRRQFAAVQVFVDFGRLWLIGGSTRVRNTSEFRVWFLKFDVYDAPE
jgi:hypothetical protein